MADLKIVSGALLVTFGVFTILTAFGVVWKLIGLIP